MEKRKRGRPRKVSVLKKQERPVGRPRIKEQESYYGIREFVITECKKRNLIITRFCSEILRRDVSHQINLKKSEFIQIKNHLLRLDKKLEAKNLRELSISLFESVVSFLKRFKHERN